LYQGDQNHGNNRFTVRALRRRSLRNRYLYRQPQRGKAKAGQLGQPLR
jgi:hypothetical protein